MPKIVTVDIGNDRAFDDLSDEVLDRGRELGGKACWNSISSKG